MEKEGNEQTQVARVTCDICGDTFKDRRGLAGHMVTHKPKTATTVAATPTEKKPEASPEKPLEAIAEQKTETPPEAPETKPPAPETAPPESKSAPSPPAAPEPELTTIKTAGIFTYEITLPSDAFTLYNLAKALELESDEKSFDEWVWDCIRARWAKDYKKQLIVAPVE